MTRPEGLPPGRASDKLLALADQHALSFDFPPEVVTEARALEDDPGLDDPELEDWTDRPFVTIDNEDSRDLDQAMDFRRRPKGGFEVAYALADAAYYVRPGTALHAEALKRGVTYYFPSFAVPMLPRVLSEGVVSLNPAVDRRAFVVVTDLDAAGRVLKTRFVRARIRSRAKLSYRGVQAWADGEESELEGKAWTDNLRLLREVGELRIKRARDADVVQVRRDEVWARVDSTGAGFEVEARRRSPVERWNEQISLLCNSEGAAFLQTP
ncbi:MAG: RNB domain-containing ribonuclease, partial [Myxococcota bacterium]